VFMRVFASSVKIPCDEPRYLSSEKARFLRFFCDYRGKNRAVRCSMSATGFGIVIPRAAGRTFRDGKNVDFAARGTCCSLASAKIDPPACITFLWCWLQRRGTRDDNFKDEVRSW